MIVVLFLTVKGLGNTLVGIVQVAPQLVDDPKPQLWRLMNPTASAWGGEAPDLQLVDASALDFRTTSLFYVHGTSYGEILSQLHAS
jgi:hypothetical protein